MWQLSILSFFFLIGIFFFISVVNVSDLMIFFLINDLNTFGSHMFLTLKIINFENMILTKVVHIYAIENMNR